MNYLFLIWCIFLLISGGSTVKDFSSALHDLSGHWAGTGYTVIGVPSFTNDADDFDLKLFHTCESLVFSGIREKIRNAGDDEETFLKSLTYMHEVVDHTTGGELHVEPGIWVHEPADDLGLNDQRLFRVGNIPHGNTFIAGSTLVSEWITGGPEFEDGFTVIPFPFGFDFDPNQRITGNYVNQYADQVDDDGNLVVGTAIPIPESMQEKYGDIGAEIRLDPIQFLIRDNEAAEKAGQKIVSTREIDISSVATVDGTDDGQPLGGVLNIPMLAAEIGQAANISQIEVKMYLEQVKDVDGTYFYQLQYVQEIYINFPIFKTDPPLITWPHVSVATLRKIAGEYVS